MLIIGKAENATLIALLRMPWHDNLFVYYPSDLSLLFIVEGFAQTNSYTRLDASYLESERILSSQIHYTYSIKCRRTSDGMQSQVNNYRHNSLFYDNK